MTPALTPAFPEKIDSTMIAALSACEQKFFNEFCLCLTPKARSPDLHAGGAFAHGIEFMRREYYVHGRSLRQSVPLLFNSFAHFWNDYEPPEDHPKSFTNTFCAILDYFREYPLETDPLQPYWMADGKPAIEFTFSLPLEIAHPVTGLPILYCGRCDMIGYYMDVLRVVDEKTTKSFSYNWAESWNMRGQFIGYVWAAQMHGFPLNSALIRGIAIQKTQYKHMQAPIEYPQWQIDLWYETTVNKIKHAVEVWQRNEPRDPETWHAPWQYSFGDACTSYGLCPYMGLCTRWEPWRWYDDYERRVWDPLHKDPTHMEQSRLSAMNPVLLEGFE